jgi:hypothetical protein
MGFTVLYPSYAACRMREAYPTEEHLGLIAAKKSFHTLGGDKRNGVRSATFVPSYLERLCPERDIATTIVTPEARSPRFGSATCPGTGGLVRAKDCHLPAVHDFAPRVVDPREWKRICRRDMNRDALVFTDRARL